MRREVDETTFDDDHPDQGQEHRPGVAPLDTQAVDDTPAQTHEEGDANRSGHLWAKRKEALAVGCFSWCFDAFGAFWRCFTVLWASWAMFAGI